MLRSVYLLSFIGALFLSATAHAGKVSVWDHHATSDYDKARFDHAVVSNEGAVRLSRRLRPLANIDAAHVWDVIEDARGNLIVATGDEGKLYRVTPEGKTTVIYSGEETEIFCLTAGSDGSVYAGTGPHGQVLRVKPDGTVAVFCQTPEHYVWSLTIDSRDQLYAGTGAKGRIFQVTADGTARMFYQTRQNHVLTVAAGPDGTIYAGTDRNGLVYRIDARGKGFVLYSAPQAEVRSLLVTANAIYAGTCSPGRQNLSYGSSGSSGDRSEAVKGRTVSLSKGSANRTMVASRHGHLSESSSGDRSGTSPSHGAAGYGENSLYRIGFDGSVREIFREKALLLSLLRERGRIFVGTGSEGRIFEVNESSKEKSQIAHLDHGQIHCLYRRHDGSIVVGAGDPGKLYVLEDRYAANGTVTSEVLDARMISKWGTLSWKAETPPATALSLAVRTGNVADPDDTWSDWSEEQTDSAHATVTTPSARYLQYRVTLRSDDANVTPTLRGVAIRYRTTNQAPEVSNIEVPDLDAGTADNAKKVKLHWSASDPNGDTLMYTLYARKDGWKNWIKLADDIEKKDYEWDTTSMPSGSYRLKVVASDRKDNSPEEALSSSRISEPFVVAHQPPTVKLRVVGMDGEQAVIEATATDPLVRLTAASFAVNSKKWTPVFPTDGLFDSKSEAFRFKTPSLEAGSYVLVLRVTDAAGNTGSADAVFTVRRK